jgi:hypothetical protein
MRKAWEWFIARFNEKSTIANLAAAGIYSATLPYPLSMIAFVIQLALAFVPDGPIVKPAA